MPGNISLDTHTPSFQPKTQCLPVEQHHVRVPRSTPKEKERKYQNTTRDPVPWPSYTITPSPRAAGHDLASIIPRAWLPTLYEM